MGQVLDSCATTTAGSVERYTWIGSNAEMAGDQA